MKYFWLSIILILSINHIHAQDKKIELIKEVDLNKIDTKKYEIFSVELLTANNKKIGKHKCINLDALIDNKNSNLLIEISNSKGEKNYITIDELNDNISQQTPLIFVDDVVTTLGDTLVLGENELSKLENNELLNSELSSITNFRLMVNIKDWSNKMTDIYFKPKTIIFPVDKSTERWIVNADRIRVYKLD